MLPHNDAEYYEENFYKKLHISQNDSAADVICAINEYIQPDSVVDVGCGLGGFLAEWEKRGVKDITGIDGDYVDRKWMLIPPERFIAHDLTKPLLIKRRFDLAMCLEVVEHLNQEYARQTVELLCGLSDVVAFSAAIPGQGGTHHVNEQYLSYWHKIFEDMNYRAIDCVRPLLWNNKNIHRVYKQNLIIFVKTATLEKYPALYTFNRTHPGGILDIIHPDLWERATFWKVLSESSLRDVMIRRIEKAANGRQIAIWGTGFNANIIQFLFRQVGFAENMIFLDAKKSETEVQYMPITPLSQIENAADLYYVVISPSAHHQEIYENLSKLGYGAEDCFIFTEQHEILRGER